jgi:serine/threonine protein kinase
VYEVIADDDGRHYAIKRMLKPLISRRDRLLRMREFSIYNLVCGPVQGMRGAPLGGGGAGTGETSDALGSGRLSHQHGTPHPHPHPNIVQYYVPWQQEGLLYFKTELCEGGSFRNALRALPDNASLPEETVWTFVAHVASALHHLHALGVVHLDVKPDNVLISGTTLKLADFGVAVEYARLTRSSHTMNDEPSEAGNLSQLSGSATESAGTHNSSQMLVEYDNDEEGDSGYMAPELLQSHGECRSFV